MGVDTSVSVGVGFVIDPEAFGKYRATIPDEENYADEELLENLLAGNRSGLCCGTGGSYYEDKPPTHWVAIKRLTNSYDTSDIPGGVVGLDRPVITIEEREALSAIARIIGMNPADIKFGQFMSVLWH